VAQLAKKLPEFSGTGDQWRDLVNTVMKLRVLQKKGNPFMT